MFKHLSKLFDYQELPEIINEYDRLRVGGQNAEAAVLRLKIANLLSDRRPAQNAVNAS
jgi:hypothetical protein